jgi:hypothetical protein
LEEYERDMQKLGLVMSEHGIRAFEAIAEGSVYIQTSLKTGTVKIYALDFENLV